jgi:acetyl-CoA acetyltransferase
MLSRSTRGLLPRFWQLWVSCIWKMTLQEVSPNGDAIALDHPLGMRAGSGLVATAPNQFGRGQGCYGLCALCTGVGQGLALVFERA